MTYTEKLALIVAAYKFAGVPNPEYLAAAYLATLPEYR